MSYSLFSVLHSPVASSLLDPNILLSTLFSNILSLRSSVNVSDQDSHLYKTTSKIKIYELLHFDFVHFWTNHQFINEHENFRALFRKIVFRFEYVPIQYSF